ncbi:MAG TPA: hypothetical protein VGE74_22460 [Gemmata sp.]
MARKLLLSWVVGAGAVLGLCSTPRFADAAPPAQIRFQVLVQEGSGWVDGGVFLLRSEARQEAMRLCKEGHRVLIQEVAVGAEK